MSSGMPSRCQAESSFSRGKIAAGGVALVAVLVALSGVSSHWQHRPAAVKDTPKLAVATATHTFTLGPLQRTCEDSTCLPDEIAYDIQVRAAAVGDAARRLAHSYDGITAQLEASPLNLRAVLPALQELEHPFLQVQEASTFVGEDLRCQLGDENGDADRFVNATNEIKAAAALVRGSLLKAALSARKCSPHIAARQARSKSTRESYAQFEQTRGDDPVKRVEMFVANDVVRTTAHALLDVGTYVSDRSAFTKAPEDMLWAEKLLQDSEHVARDKEELGRIRLQRATSLETHAERFAKLPSNTDMQAAVQRLKLATDGFLMQGNPERASQSQVRLAGLLAARGYLEEALNASGEALILDEISSPASTLQVILHMKLGMLRTSDDVLHALQILEGASGKLTSWPEIERERTSLEQVFREWRIPAEVSFSASNAGSFRDLGMACASLDNSARTLLCLLLKVAFPS